MPLPVEPDVLEATIPSPLPLLAEVLRADEPVTTLATSGVFTSGLPRTVISAMPTPCVLLQMSGGRPLGDDVPAWRYRVRANCYGGPDQANQTATTHSHHLALAVMRALHNRGPFFNEVGVIHSVICTAGPIEMRDTAMNGAVLQGLFFMAYMPLVPFAGGAT